MLETLYVNSSNFKNRNIHHYGWVKITEHTTEKVMFLNFKCIIESMSDISLVLSYRTKRSGKFQKSWSWSSSHNNMPRMKPLKYINFPL